MSEIVWGLWNLFAGIGIGMMLEMKWKEFLGDEEE
jgi:hypothetical protein